nr:response regulator [Chthoniobacterales bacterium]
LLDLHLPDIPGWEVLAHLKAGETTQNVPVVVISADATARQMKRLLAAGAHTYLTKPVDVVEFPGRRRDDVRCHCGERTGGRVKFALSRDAFGRLRNLHRDGGSAQHGRMKLLIIDDEPVNVALLQDILAESGYTRVQSVTDSRTAVDTCLAFKPDLVLLDLMMPHVDGFTVLEALRTSENESFVPVIVLTADANEETERRALRAGATDFLLKPFDHLEVLLRIGNLLELRRLHLHLDNQRAALEEAVFLRTAELREAQAQLAQTSA